MRSHDSHCLKAFFLHSEFKSCWGWFCFSSFRGQCNLTCPTFIYSAFVPKAEKLHIILHPEYKLVNPVYLGQPLHTFSFYRTPLFPSSTQSFCFSPDPTFIKREPCLTQMLHYIFSHFLFLSLGQFCSWNYNSLVYRPTGILLPIL